MEELIKLVSEENQEKFKELSKGYVKLTDEVALEYVRASQSLTDKVSTPQVEAAIANFEKDKLPGFLKAEAEKVRAELNPKETPEQKEIRELKEWKAEQIRDTEISDLAKSLREKAKELEYDILEAESLTVYGDKAMSVLEARAEREKGLIEKARQGVIKDKLSGKPPGGGDPPKGDPRSELIKQYDAAEVAGNGALMLSLKEQIRKLPKE